ncbi:uncharacterized protein ACBR49_018797 isoform 1-T2 [Aulostomus maculatus]
MIKLQFLLILLLPEVQAEPIMAVSAYVGESVILPSGANPSWNLSSVRWSVYYNETWIATYHTGTKNLERFYRYTGRLHLNISSGNLMIDNLTKDDGLEYKVELVTTGRESKENTIKLNVRQHLQQLTIETMFIAPTTQGCWVGLRCLSPDEGVQLSWEVRPSLTTPVNTCDLDGTSGSPFIFFKKIQNPIQVTCVAKKCGETSRRVFSPPCQETTSQHQLSSRARGAVFTYIGIVIGLSLSAIICFLRRKSCSHFSPKTV